MEQSRQPPIVGLDVSKAWLDGYLAPSGRRLRVGNDGQGVADLVQALGDHAGCLVVMEASGDQRLVRRPLVAARGLHHHQTAARMGERPQEPVDLTRSRLPVAGK